MTEDRVDFLIVGATPLARLLAGLLASAHGKSVIFQGESQSGYRLPRGIDLSVAAITRPETWALLKACVPETIKLVSRIAGRGSWSRIDPIIFADRGPGRAALAHVRHMAGAFGHAAERVPTTLLGPGRDGLVLRDSIMLRRPILEPALDRWLDQLGVRRLDSWDGLSVAPDGSAQLVDGTATLAIGQTVLADDLALVSHLSAHAWPSLLATQVATTILTEPTAPIAAPVMHQLDTGLVLTQQAERGIAALGPGALDQFAAALNALLGRQRQYRQAGQSQYQRVVTLDGGPAVGRVGGSGPDVLAGLGPVGAFLAPALARWLCGTANERENAWLGARLVDRTAQGSAVADVGDRL